MPEKRGGRHFGGETSLILSIKFLKDSSPRKGFRLMKWSNPWTGVARKVVLCGSALVLPIAAARVVAQDYNTDNSSATSPSDSYYISAQGTPAPTLAPEADPAAVAAAKKKADAAKKKKAEDLKKKVATAYKDPFYMNDFSYLKDPNYKGSEIGEGLKGMSVGPGGKIDVGGQYRLRYHGEHNMRGLGLTGRDDDFLLDRTRIYADYKVNKRFRLFAEGLDAGSSYENFAPRGIEVQQLDAQNLFADVALYDEKDGKLVARGGRQELLLGAQRLASPLDWANTRRTFEGGRLTWSDSDQTTDFLLLRPMNLNVKKFDSPNQDQVLYGMYNSNKAILGKDAPIDTYYFGFENDVTFQRIHTIGTLLKGEKDSLLWDNEFGYQFGRNGDSSDASAFSLTFGIGKKLKGDLKPVVWMYYDWASGDDSINNGWNHLFPLGHRYNGFMDLFGRRNLHDLNASMTVSPSEKFTVLAWYHYFALSNGNQGPYNVTLSPFLPGGTVGSKDLGHEIDLLGTYKVNKRSDLVLGYSHFFSGDFYRLSRNAADNPIFNGDADFFYTQWHYNF
jgi:Alginate export